MVDHPCKGMTKAQIAAFEQIATGVALPPAHHKTLAALEAKGLIVRTPNKVLGRDGFGAVSIPQYAVPINVHMQWCEWCAENVTDEATP